MSRLSQAKLALAAAALAAFAWGVRTDDRRATAVAIGLLALAFLLRFAEPRERR